jgi:hypothetical protein
VVEACHSWFNRFRKLVIRYEKLDSTHLALTHLAAAIIALQKASSFKTEGWLNNVVTHNTKKFHQDALLFTGRLT